MKAHTKGWAQLQKLNTNFAVTLLLVKSDFTSVHANVTVNFAKSPNSSKNSALRLKKLYPVFTNTPLHVS